MILENVFVTEIQLDNGTEMEFVDKGWYALNMHKEFPEEKINIDAFFDWAEDLFWIKQEKIIIIIRGKMLEETSEIIKDLNEYWSKEVFELEKNLDDIKKVDFIIAD